MMDGLGQSSQDFVQGIQDMVQRLERLERIARLFLAPILPYKHDLKREAFFKYLEAHCSLEWNDEDKPWKAGNLTGEFEHKQTMTTVKVPDQWSTDGTYADLLDLLLTIASFEGRMPARVLADIQPDIFPSAIDALALATQEFPE